MQESGVIESTTTFDRSGAWTVFWKRHGSATDFKDLLLTVGLCKGYEEAIEKVILKLDADPFWAREFRGGVFYPVLISAGVKVADTGWRPGSIKKVMHL